jgi:hypothetical protein
MRDVFLYLIEHPLRVGVCAGVTGLTFIVVSLLTSRTRWILRTGVSFFVASSSALLPAAFIHARAVAVYNPGGGDFSGMGLLLVPIVFYLIWLPTLPVCFLIAISSPTLRGLGQ